MIIIIIYYYNLKLLPSIGACGIGFSRASDKSTCKSNRQSNSHTSEQDI